MADDGLFDIEAARAQPALNADQKRIARQAEAIRRGGHPLALTGAYVLLHPDCVGQEATKDNAASRPLRCGTCWYRTPGEYPKCVFTPAGATVPPRVSHGPATDCRSWWPACTDWEAAT